MIKPRALQIGVANPRQFQLASTPGEMFRSDDEVVANKVETDLKDAFDLFTQLRELFPLGRRPPKVQRRPRL